MLSSLTKSLHQLQIEQYRHDEIAHRDIAWLPVPTRLTHFTLHFAKYAGALVSAQFAGNADQAKRVLADTFAIVLAMANTLNVDLQARLAGIEQPADISGSDVNALLLRLCEAIGPMAKACEAVDHMENFPSRATLDIGVIRVLQIVAAIADKVGINLAEAAAARWVLAERKSFLFAENRSPTAPAFLTTA